MGFHFAGSLFGSAHPVTPESVRSVLNAWVRTCSLRLSRLSEKMGSFFLLLICSLYGCFLYFLTINPDWNNNHTSFFETRYFWVIPTVVVLFGVANLGLDRLRVRDVNLRLLVIFALVWMVLPQVLSYADPMYSPKLIRIAILFVLSVNLLVLVLVRRVPLSLKVLFFIATELSCVVYLKTTNYEGYFGESFWIIQPLRYVFVFSYLSISLRGPRLSTLREGSFWSFIMSPTVFITPLPISTEFWRPSESKEELNFLRGKAGLYLLLGLLSLLLTFVIQRMKFAAHLGSPLFGWRDIVGGVLTYLYYYTFSFSNIVIPVSLLWWLGFKIPEPYDSPLLATTPQDRWRRWNFLFYEWYFKFIFFPVYKKTRSSFLAVALSFAATMMIHLGPRNSEFIIFTVDDQLSRLFIRKVVFFSIHGLLVYAGLKLEPFLPKPNQRRAWLSVICMFVIMSALHYIFFR